MAFTVNLSALPAGKIRQFADSMAVRDKAVTLGLNAIIGVSSPYLDCRTGEEKTGFFIAGLDNPSKLVWLITEKRFSDGGLFPFEALSSQDLIFGNPDRRGYREQKLVDVWKPIPN